VGKPILTHKAIRECMHCRAALLLIVAALCMRGVSGWGFTALKTVHRGRAHVRGSRGLAMATAGAALACHGSLRRLRAAPLLPPRSPAETDA
jgi:hypothetical protein